MKGFSSKRITLKVDELQDQKIHCLQARRGISRSGNCIGWGVKGLNCTYPRLAFAWIMLFKMFFLFSWGWSEDGDGEVGIVCVGVGEWGGGGDVRSKAYHLYK